MNNFTNEEIMNCYFNLNNNEVKLQNLINQRADLNLLIEKLSSRIEECKQIIRVVDGLAIQDVQSLGYMRCIRPASKNGRFCLYYTYDPLNIEFCSLPDSTFYLGKDKEDVLNVAIDWIVHKKLPTSINNA